MYWGAKPNGRVIEKAKNISLGYVLAAFLVLIIGHASLNDLDKKISNDNANIALDIAQDIAPDLALGGLVEGGEKLPILSVESHQFASEDDGEVLVSSGSMLELMDDSFLGQITSEKFWGGRKKKKKYRPSAAELKRKRAAEIAATPRSGLINSKPGSGAGFWFGGGSIFSPDRRNAIVRPALHTGGYRTLCVRLSDGYYWPVSSATSKRRFSKDTRSCKSSCGEPVRLFYYANSNGQPEDMVDVRGRRYSDLENAWRYREEYLRERKCKPHPWEEASLARHQHYAVTAAYRIKAAYKKRSKSRSKRRVRRSVKRKLVRVGRVRTMSSVATDYENDTKLGTKARVSVTKARSRGRNGKIAGNVRVSSGSKQGSVSPTKVKVQTKKKSARKKRVASRRVGNSRMMRLGAKRARVKPARRVKKRSRRTKSKRRARWAREAFNFD